MFRTATSIFCLILWATLVPAAAQERVAPDLEALIQEALANNPELQAARFQAEAALNQVPQAEAWDPPQVGVDFYQTPVDSFPDPTKDRMEVDYFIQQMFPFPGKRSEAGRSARSGAAMLSEASRAQATKLVRDIKSAYYDLYLVQRKIEINEGNQQLMREFAATARRQYEVGRGRQADILRAQMELSTLINEGLNLAQSRRSAEAMLNTLLNRPADQALGRVPPVDRPRPQLNFQALQALSLDNRPELQAMRHSIDMSSAELALAEKEYFPDLMLRLTYKDVRASTDDYWSTMVAINVPLAPWSLGKYSGKVAENRIGLKRAEANYKTMENMVAFQIQDSLVKLESGHNTIALYRDTIIPQAEQTLQSTRAAYGTGDMDFLALLDAYRALLAARLDFHMAVMSTMTSEAALEQAVGLRISEITARAD